MLTVRLTEQEKAIHPSIHVSGSIRGMKKLGYWGKNDTIVRCGNYYYNLSIICWGHKYIGE